MQAVNDKQGVITASTCKVLTASDHRPVKSEVIDVVTLILFLLFSEEPSKAAIKNKKKREAKARRKAEEGEASAVGERLQATSIDDED